MDFAAYSRGRALVGLALVALGSLLEAVGLVWLVGVVRLVLIPNSAGSSQIALLNYLDPAASPARNLILTLIVFAMLIAIRGVVAAARDALLARLQFGYVETVKRGLLRKVAKAPWHKVARIRHGRVVHALTLDLQQLGVATYYGMQAGVALVMICGSCLLALVVSPMLALTAGLLLLGALAGVPFLARATSLGASLSRRQRDVTEGLLSLLGGLKAAKAQDLQDRFISEVEAASGAALDARLAFLRMQSAVRSLWSVLTAIAGGATLAIGILVLHAHPEAVIAVLLILSRVTAPAVTLHQGLHYLLQSAPAFAAIRELEAQLEDVGPVAHPSAELIYQESSFAIEMRAVTLLHGGEREGEPGLRDVTLAIAPGEFIGIEGPSGAGKTTFVDLVAGILEPQSGSVVVGGVKLAGETLRVHQAGLGYVAQDAFLFDKNVRQNLIFARPDASDAEMWRALELAGADALVRELGLDAPLGTRGALISAGQKQRLALACALLRRPSLLILDEATNALDIDSEAAILGRLATLDPRPTILMIAHRPQSLALCGRILRFTDGRLLSDVARGDGDAPGALRI